MSEYYDTTFKINTLASRRYLEIKMLLVVCPLFLPPLNMMIIKKHNMCAQLTC